VLRDLDFAEKGINVARSRLDSGEGSAAAWLDSKCSLYYIGVLRHLWLSSWALDFVRNNFGLACSKAT
jgi:hypothetical protein